MRPNLITRLKEEWNNLDPVDPLRGLIADAIDALAPQPAQQEPVAWHGYDLDGMVEAFDRVIQAHYNSKQPFHSPVDSDAQMALRILRGFIPSMKRYTSPPASKPLTDERTAFKQYIDECDKCCIVPDAAGAFHAAWQAAHGIKEKNNG